MLDDGRWRSRGPRRIPRTRPAEGIWLLGHVAVRRLEGGASISLTPSLTSLLEPDSRAVLIANGSRVEEGDALAVIRSGGHRLVVRTPVAGRVEKVNLALARGRGRARTVGQASRIARIRCTEEQLDEAPIAWGRHGRQAYRTYLRSLHDDEGILESLSLEHHRTWSDVSSWGELSAVLGKPRREANHPLPDSDSVLALAPLLDGWIQEDDHLREGLSTLGLDIRFKVTDRDADLVIASGVVTARVDGDGVLGTAPDLTLTLEAAHLHGYLRGELDLAAALGIEVGIEGTRLDAMLATSLLQRLFPRYRKHVARLEARCQLALAAA